MQDLDFTAAMEKAVSRRGADFQYPRFDRTAGATDFHMSGGTPTYQDGRGNATCLIGAAIAELGLALPSRDRAASAQAVLAEFGFSTKVTLAARAAQVHQDYHRPWGECLRVYEAALEYFDEARAAGEYLSMYSADAVYYGAVKKVGVKPAYGGMGSMGIMSEFVPNKITVSGSTIDGDKIMANWFDELAQTTKKISDAVAVAKAQIDEHIAAFEAKPESPTFPQVAKADTKTTFAKGGIVSGGKTTITMYPPIESIYVNAFVNPASSWVGTTQKEHALTA